MSEYKKFGELSRDEQIELVVAGYVDIKNIDESDNTKQWAYTVFPKFDPDLYYRKTPVKPSINWDHVHPNYNYLAEDEDGLAYVFKSRPVYSNDKWIHIKQTGYVDDLNRVSAFASYKPGDCDWRESLVCRPGFEKEC